MFSKIVNKSIIHFSEALFVHFCINQTFFDLIQPHQDISHLCPLRHILRWKGVIVLKIKFLLSVGLGLVWLSVSSFFAIGWAREVSYYLPAAYVWWVIIGIALLPGFLMSTMFFSNLMHARPKRYSDICLDTTVLIAAHNEERTIAQTIEAIFNQHYRGKIRIIVVDNGSTDKTQHEILKMRHCAPPNCSVTYAYCGTLGKANALNFGLRLISTPYFITVDADTYLECNAVQRIMNHIVAEKSACVAGNLFVKNAKSSLIARMQNYDYLLSIAAVKRFQGSYESILVAQGAFSAYQTCVIRNIGGWRNVMGEDIVLTYEVLKQGFSTTYEPCAVGYTIVPETLDAFYNQRKRWAIGMLDGLGFVPPWKQGTMYSRYFTSVNILVVYLDLAFLFGFIPAIILALFGCYYFAGLLTFITVALCTILFASMYLYQKRLKIPFENSLIGFVFFLLFFQAIQSTAALHGYLIRQFRRKEEWK